MNERHVKMDKKMGRGGGGGGHSQLAFDLCTLSLANPIHTFALILIEIVGKQHMFEQPEVKLLFELTVNIF